MLGEWRRGRGRFGGLGKGKGGRALHDSDEEDGRETDLAARSLPAHAPEPRHRQAPDDEVEGDARGREAGVEGPEVDAMPGYVRFPVALGRRAGVDGDGDEGEEPEHADPAEHNRGSPEVGRHEDAFVGQEAAELHQDLHQAEEEILCVVCFAPERGRVNMDDF
jgi:hypothetical protein